MPDGWANYEDLPGNFLLIPPSGSNDGVDAGTSDYIGVYDGVAPVSGECEERPEPSVALTPEAMGAWYASHPGLVVDGPEPVTIGGLAGVVLDLARAEGDAGVCDIPEIGDPFVPILIGVGPAELTHALGESFSMRLYLLTAPSGEVIAIEIDDVPGGDTIESMTQVAESMQFAKSSTSVRDGEAWVVFQSLADQFEPGADDDGIEHDDTIFLVRTDGTGLHRLPPEDFVGSETRPTWSPDGRRIAFIRARFADDHGELWTINADGTGAELLYTCVGPNVPDSDCNSSDYPDWSPDGGAIYFARDSNPPPEGDQPLTFEVWRYDLETGEAAAVLTREDRMTVEQPRLSVDGQHVVYVRYRAELESAIFIAELATGEEHRITEWNLLAAYPDWSVDDVIVFNSYDLRIFADTTSAANLYSVAADGSDLHQLTDHGRNDTRATQPRWMADGRGIVYTQVTRSAADPFGERHLAYIDANGTNARLLIPQPIVGTHPELRPPPSE